MSILDGIFDGKEIITQKFGNNFINPKTGKNMYGADGHNGIDYRATVGAPVHSIIDGKAEVKNTGDKDYGLSVRIVNDLLGIRVIYGHLSETNLVTGAIVTKGSVVGKTGNTGNSTAPHLHLSIQRLSDKKFIDPETYEPLTSKTYKDNEYYQIMIKECSKDFIDACFKEYQNDTTTKCITTIGCWRASRFNGSLIN